MLGQAPRYGSLDLFPDWLISLEGELILGVGGIIVMLNLQCADSF